MSPLPGKLSFSTSPKTLSLRFNSAPMCREAEPLASLLAQKEKIRVTLLNTLRIPKVYLLLASDLDDSIVNYKLALAMGTCHGHLPSTSTKIKSGATAAANFQHPVKGVQDGEQK